MFSLIVKEALVGNLFVANSSESNFLMILTAQRVVSPHADRELSSRFGVGQGRIKTTAFFTFELSPCRRGAGDISLLFSARSKIMHACHPRSQALKHPECKEAEGERVASAQCRSWSGSTKLMEVNC
jgi:hypothetical protein